MADIKWSSFPSTTGTTAGDSVVGLHSGANERFLVSSTPVASGIAIWDANKNLLANNTITASATTETAAGTTTLTVASKYQQYITGSTTQTVVMPVTSTLAIGQSYLLVNDSSGNVTVNSSDASLILTMTPNTAVIVACISTGVTTNAAWSYRHALNDLSPTNKNSNYSFTGGNLSDVQSVTAYYGSIYLLGTYYVNLLQGSFNPATILGPSVINLGNLAVSTSGIILSSANLTSFTADSMLLAASGVTLNAPLLTTFSMTNLLSCHSVFTITSANSLVTLSLPELKVVGLLNIVSAASLVTINMPNLVYIFGVLQGTAPSLTALSMNNLQIIYGNFTLTANTLTSLSLPSLIQIGYIGNFVVAGNFAINGTLLQTINMPSLVSVNGTFSPTLAALTSLTLTSLQNVTGAFGLTAATLATLSLPALTTLGAGFSPVCASATTVTLTLLANVTGTFVPSFAALTTLSLPALVSISGLLTITAANLVTFSMGSTLKSIGGNFTMTGMKLDQASVDGILVSLAALDGTGGTTAYSSKTINLSGGTSSAPSATGLAAKATLQARSCTVTTN